MSKHTGKKQRLAVVVSAFALVMGLLVGTVAVPTTVPATVSAASKVSQSKAESIALKNAGTTSSKAEALKSSSGSYKGRSVYNVSFYKKKSDTVYTHYLYKINRNTGKIADRKAKKHTIISQSKAESIALDDVDISRSDTSGLDSELGRKGSKLVWEVTFDSDEDDDDDDDDDTYYYPYSYRYGTYSWGDNFTYNGTSYYYHSNGNYYTSGSTTGARVGDSNINSYISSLNSNYRYYYNNGYYNYGHDSKGYYYYNSSGNKVYYSYDDDDDDEDEYSYSYTINAITGGIIDSDRDKN